MSSSVKQGSALEQNASHPRAYWQSLPGWAARIYPDLPPARRLKKAAVFCINGMRMHKELQQLQSIFECAELRDVVEYFPSILDKPFHPYVCAQWTLEQRLEGLQQHFLMLKEAFGSGTSEIYKPAGLRLFEFHNKVSEQMYSVQLFQGYQAEGATGIRLCDEQEREIYSLSFHLSSTPKKCCHVGALQGPNDRIPDRQQTIVALTRSLHGLRPKALMVEVLYMVLAHLDVKGIYGVSNAGHIYQAKQFSDAKRAQVEFDFDQLWEEYHGTAHTESYFKLPPQPVRKELELLKSKKRALYRKRYAWLESATTDTRQTLLALSDRADSAVTKVA